PRWGVPGSPGPGGYGWTLRGGRPPGDYARQLDALAGFASAELDASVRRQEVGEVGRKGVDADALLLHRVALANRDRLVVQRVEVDGDAERRADLVLAAVAAADRARVIELGGPALAQPRGDVAGLRRQVRVARQRQ